MEAQPARPPAAAAPSTPAPLGREELPSCQLVHFPLPTSRPEKRERDSRRRRRNLPGETLIRIVRITPRRRAGPRRASRRASPRGGRAADSGGGGYLSPAPGEDHHHAVARPRRRLASRSRISAASAAAASGAVQMPFQRGPGASGPRRSRPRSPPAPRPRSRAGCGASGVPRKGPGTRRPAAWVTGFSHMAVVSAFSCQARTTGAQPSAWTATKRGWGDRDPAHGGELRVRLPDPHEAGAAARRDT